MKSAIILLVLSAAVLGGCSSAYKTGQTPDDVYFSPQRPQDEYVNIQDNDQGRYDGDDQYYDDQYLRMKVRNRVMWSELDNYYYNPMYSFSYYNGWNWNNPWNPYTYWNYYYNPYCSPVIITGKPSLAYNHPRMFNLNTYNTNQLTNRNYTNPKGSGNNNVYNNYNTPIRIGSSNSRSSINSNTGNFLRNIFNSPSSNNNNNNNNSSYSNPGRSSSSSSSSSSGSSSGSSGGTAPVRRF